MKLTLFKRAFADRLGLRLVLASLLISTTLSAVAAGLQLYLSYQRQRDGISEILDQIGDVIASPLEKAMWKFDTDQIDVILDSVFSDGAVSVLVLEAPNGDRWERGQGEAFDIKRSYELRHTGSGGDQLVVGELTVFLSLDEVNSRIWAQFWTLLGSNLIKAYLSASMLLLLFFFFVTKPLKEIADFIEQGDPHLGDRDLELSRGTTRHNDDLDKIVSALNQSRRQLKQKINDLREEVTTRKAAEIEAKQSSEVRKAFIANMSHEVRTPLNAIMGLFQLIQMADVPERQKKQAEVGLNASHHLLAQLVNVLEISRMEANAVKIVASPTKIRPLADQWLETAKATLHRLKKPIDVSLQIAEGTPEFCKLDPRRVTQIVNNLTDNALKFTKEGQVEIAVCWVADPNSAENGSLEVSVSDTGCGIEEDKLGAVFDRFIQVDGAETRENGGSGLGLAISRELAHLMEATLDVISPSKNNYYTTTFTLRMHLN